MGLSRPSAPYQFLPQHLTFPPSSSAHVCSLPAEIAITFTPVPRLTSGRLSPISTFGILFPSTPSPTTFSVVPIPSKFPAPQHLTLWSLSSAHVCCSPA